MARCKTAGCNALDAKHMRELNRIHQEILSITVTVDEVRNKHTISGGKKSYVWEKVTEKQWEVFNGSWSFDRLKDRSPNESVFNLALSAGRAVR